MSTMIMSACWPLQMPPTPKAVLISLADNANDHGECWPSIPKIAERTCFSERAVHTAIRWLEQHGLVEADRSNGRHTRYIVDPNGYKPPQEVHPRRRCTPAGDAVKPLHLMQSPLQEVQSPLQQVQSNRKEPSRTKSRNPRAGKATFDDWNRRLGNEEAIPANDPIFNWTAKAGIPDEYVELAWLAFDDRFSGADKTYADWRAAFRNYVKNGWLNIWRPSRAGGYELTDTGLQWQRVLAAMDQEAAA